MPDFLSLRLHISFQLNNNISIFSSEQIKTISNMKLQHIVLFLAGSASLPSILATPAPDVDDTQLTSNLGVEKLMSRSDYMYQTELC